MSLRTEAYVVSEKGAKLELKEITLPPLKSSEVEIKMTHCGLCHTDIHMQNNDWGITNFPLVPGHEGVGIVSVVGDACRSLKVGDRVGITWIRNSCKSCGMCQEGRGNLCAKGYQGVYLASGAGCWGKEPYNEHGGCFSKVMRVEEEWAIKVPDGLATEAICPLLCGGGTVFEPVCDYVKLGTTVGVVGIGGLGTAAVKLSKTAGGVVTAISRSERKKDAILKDGAGSFILSSDPEQMKAAAGSLDVIIDTTPANADVAQFMDLLKFDGTYCRVGIPEAKDAQFSYNFIPLIFTQKKIAGSIVTGSRRMNLLCDVVMRNQDYFLNSSEWKAETVPFAQVNEAMERLVKGENKGWRYILAW